MYHTTTESRRIPHNSGSGSNTEYLKTIYYNGNVNSYYYRPPPSSPNGATASSEPGPPYYRGFTITLRHTTFGRTPLDE